MVVDLVKNKQIAKFQVGYMSYTVLNKIKAFKDQVDINISLKFWKYNTGHYKKVVEER